MTSLQKHFMLKAKQASKQSKCQRRQIGVVIPVEGITENIWGYNTVHERHASKNCCSKDVESECPAVHAEVAAINHLSDKEKKVVREMYCWCEIPCKQCLTYINHFTNIERIFCLTANSYSSIYPIVMRADRVAQILNRRHYAKTLGIDVIELDLEEVTTDELLKHSETNV